MSSICRCGPPILSSSNPLNGGGIPFQDTYYEHHQSPCFTTTSNPASAASLGPTDGGRRSSSHRATPERLINLTYNKNNPSQKLLREIPAGCADTSGKHGPEADFAGHLRQSNNQIDPGCCHGLDPEKAAFHGTLKRLRLQKMNAEPCFLHPDEMPTTKGEGHYHQVEAAAAAGNDEFHSDSANAQQRRQSKPERKLIECSINPNWVVCMYQYCIDVFVLTSVQQLTRRLH